MRCLRCALDFGPEERYCDRCGRALSRPLGEETVDANAVFSLATDTSSLYSTFAPPSFATTLAERAAARTSGGSTGRASTALALSDTRPSAESVTPEISALPPAVTEMPSLSIDLGDGEREPRLEAEVAADSQQGPEPASPSYPMPALPPPPVPLPPEKLFGDDDPGSGIHGAKEKPALIGADEHPVQRRRPTRQRGAARLDRRMLSAVVVLVVLVLAVLVVQRRYSAYSTELQTAQRLEAQHQYAVALQHYQVAANDWPFSSAARDGKARLEAVATAVAAQATATASKLQSDANAQAARAAVFENWEQLQRQAAAQLDAGASHSGR